LRSLGETEFREVFLVTKVNPERRVCIPLKSTLLLAELYYFNAARCAFGPEAELESVELELGMFVEFSNKRGIPVKLTFTPELGLRVTLGNTSVRVSQEGEVDIFDLADFPAPPEWIKDQKSTVSLGTKFTDFYTSYRANHMFVVNLFSDVRREAFTSSKDEAFFES
jgi:hypothetical protein